MSGTPSTPSRPSSRKTWLIAIPVVVLLAVVGGPFVYINFIKEDPPERLTLDDAPASDAGSSSTTAAGSEAATDGVEGAWTIGEGSQAGYRVKEVLFGQDTEGVGRTEEVTGSMTIEGTTVTAVEAEVDMASVTSDERNRDGQFRGRIMSTEEFPTATFTLTEPIDFSTLPADGEEIAATATGDLTLRGVTQSVTFEVTAKRSGATIAVNGAIVVDFDDFEIPDASGGPATVGRTGTLELLLVFTR